jgi:hypothetical protein
MPPPDPLANCSSEHHGRDNRSPNIDDGRRNRCYMRSVCHFAARMGWWWVLKYVRSAAYTFSHTVAKVVCLLIRLLAESVGLRQLLPFQVGKLFTGGREVTDVAGRFFGFVTNNAGSTVPARIGFMAVLLVHDVPAIPVRLRWSPT